MLSGISGLAIASLDAPRRAPDPCAHRSGDGVSARLPDKCVYAPGFDEAAESGRGAGLNSDAFAFRRRGDDRVKAGRLVARYAVV